MRTPDQTDGLVIETAKRGTFQITVVEKGTLDSMKNAILSSKVEGQTTIISIVPEGTNVKAGDLVCELDSSVLADKETQQEIAVEKAKAAFEQGKEDLRIQEAQNESDIEAANLKLKLAQIDLKKFIEGDLLQQKNDLLGRIKLAEENLSRAQESYEYVQRLAKKGYRTQNDLESERIAVETQKINLKLVQGEFMVLEKYTEGRTLAELEANVKEYGREIERTESKTRAALSQKVAELRARELTYEVESKKYERLVAQIKACKIYATQDGQVVYANIRDGRPTENVMIDVGVAVRERQPIINLPDLDSMKVNARIHESRISMVRPGMSAIVKIDAYPEETFHGEVDSVASVPSSTGGFGSTTREYDAVVRITDSSDKVNKLRPGLTASTEILVERREDVLQIPLQANLSFGAKQYVFAANGRKVELRAVKVGKSNANFLEILDGLTEGEGVVMNPQSNFKKEISDLEAELAKELGKEVPKLPEGLTPPKSDAPGVSPGQPGQPGSGALASLGGPGGASGAVEAAERPVAGGPPRGEGKPPEGARPPGGFDPMARFNSMDKDQDGKVTRSEAEGRMAENFENFDSDSDGSVTKDEFLAVMAKFRAAGGPPGQRQAESGGN
ncbi:efflux RND transporter periplasmic adaptor subunit [Schlesneria sp. T3-172]|uniref:efflux RND transporter periplasmic adaptor subunit n=1 Tax=Schlesneria sphaerica TaxID=3373610 RepID=UPI0037C5B005